MSFYTTKYCICGTTNVINDTVNLHYSINISTPINVFILFSCTNCSRQTHEKISFYRFSKGNAASDLLYDELHNDYISIIETPQYVLYIYFFSEDIMRTLQNIEHVYDYDSDPNADISNFESEYEYPKFTNSTTPIIW
jgi:hypothetical protein